MIFYGIIEVVSTSLPCSCCCFIALLLLQCHDMVYRLVPVVFHRTIVAAMPWYCEWCCWIARRCFSFDYDCYFCFITLPVVLFNALVTNIIKSFLRVAPIASSLIVGFYVWSGFIKLKLLLFILRWSCFLVRSGLLQVQKELFDFFPPSSYGTSASRFYYWKQSFVAIIHFLFLLKAVPSPTLVESKLVHQSWGVWASSRSPWLLSKCSFFYITVVHALQLLLHRRYPMP